jgi:hypothetical protein
MQMLSYGPPPAGFSYPFSTALIYINRCLHVRHNKIGYRCPLYAQKQTLVAATGISASCQRRTLSSYSFIPWLADEVNAESPVASRTASLSLQSDCDAARSAACLKNDLDQIPPRRFASAISKAFFSSLFPTHISKMQAATSQS